MDVGESVNAFMVVLFCRRLHPVSRQLDGEPEGEQRGNSSCSAVNLQSRLKLIRLCWCPPPAGEGPAHVAPHPLQPEQRDPQRPGPRPAGRLQAHVAHRWPRLRVPDSAAVAGPREAAVQRRPQPALQHQSLFPFSEPNVKMMQLESRFFVVIHL